MLYSLFCVILWYCKKEISGGEAADEKEDT